MSVTSPAQPNRIGATPLHEHKTAIVTGAAQGIGAAVARQLVADGALVWAVDIDGDAGRALAATAPNRIRFVDADVTDSSVLSVVADAVRDSGRVDILVTRPSMDAGHDAVEMSHALRRTGTPAEVADAVSFIASDRASFVTGATWIIDGGLGARFA